MWDLPGPGSKLVSPALAGGLSTVPTREAPLVPPANFPGLVEGASEPENKVNIVSSCASLGLVSQRVAPGPHRRGS